MKNKHYLLPAFLLLLPLANLKAQFDEFGTFIGVSNYAGDLTDRLLEPLEFNLSVGFFMRYHYTERISFKTHLYHGVISGSDANTSVDRNLWQRNLSFRSEIYELGAQAEYELVKIESGFYRSAPYVFAGASVFYFNPQAELDGKTYNLNIYRTEGKDYSLTQFAVPFGFGFKMALTDKGNVGLELGWRKTFTDYLDDVSKAYPANIRDLMETNSLTSRLSYRSQEILPDSPVPSGGEGRGNPDRKDWYMFFGLMLAVNIK